LKLYGKDIEEYRMVNKNLMAIGILESAHLTVDA
jgi:hypothetical protein